MLLVCPVLYFLQVTDHQGDTYTPQLGVLYHHLWLCISV